MGQPKNKFSNGLIKECQELVYKKSGKKITSNQAEVYLDDLARLGNLGLRVIEMKEAAKQKR